MSSGSLLICLGTIWTQLTLLVLCLKVFEGLAHVPVFPLAAAIVVSAALFFRAGAHPNGRFQLLATACHLLGGVGWMLWVTRTASVSLSPGQWAAVVLLTAAGGLACALGSEVAAQEVRDSLRLGQMKPLAPPPLPQLPRPGTTAELHNSSP